MRLIIIHHSAAKFFSLIGQKVSINFLVLLTVLPAVFKITGFY